MNSGIMKPGGEAPKPMEGASGRGRPAAFFRTVFIFLAPPVLVWAVWEVTAMLVVRSRGVPFPTPWDTLTRLFVLLRGVPLQEHTIYRHTWDSLFRWGVGFGIAAVIGMLLGLLAVWRRSIERVVLPLAYALQLIPGPAWIPVALLLFGVGAWATIFMIAATAFAPVAINVATGVRHIDETLVRAARMMGVDGSALFFRVLVPGSLPSILSGLRIGLGNGWRVLVAAEMVVGTGTGLGYEIIQARWTLDYPAAFACILVICAVGFAMEQLVFRPIERRTVERWGVRKEGV